MVSTLPAPAASTRLQTHALTALSSIPALGALYPAAYFSYVHATQVLAVTPESAVIMAAAIELLGYVIVDATIKSLEKRRVFLVVLSIAAFIGYLFVIVSLNVSLSIAQVIGADVTKWAAVFAVAMLVLLSIPAGLWGAVTSQLRQIDGQAAQVKAEQAQAHAEAVAERERAEDRENARVIELRKLDIAEAATKRSEARASRLQSGAKHAEAKHKAEFVCSCGFEAKSQAALNGHKLKHKAARAPGKEQE